MITFFCGNCGQRLETDDSAAGATANCPSCNHPMTVPAAQPTATPIRATAPARPPSPAPPTRRRNRLPLILGIVVLGIVVIGVMFVVIGRLMGRGDEEALPPGERPVRADTWAEIDQIEADRARQDEAQRPKRSVAEWVAECNQAAANLYDPKAIIRMDKANQRLAVAYEGALRDQWNRLPCTIDPEFLTDENLEPAALEWAKKSLPSLFLADPLMPMAGTRPPIRVFVRPPRANPDGQQARELRDTIRAFRVELPSEDEIDARYRDSKPDAAVGNPFSTETALEYRFKEYDPNRYALTLAAAIPTGKVLHIPGRAPAGEVYAEDYPSIIVTPEVHSMKGALAESEASSPFLYSPGTGNTARSIRVVRYPDPAAEADVLTVMLGGEGAAQMKRSQTALQVRHTCSVEFVWLVVPRAISLEFYRKELADGHKRPPVELDVTYQTWIRISTEHTLNGVSLPYLPNSAAWAEILKTGKKPADDAAASKADPPVDGSTPPGGRKSNDWLFP